ncbi:MAG: hypothetical protein IKO47_04230 [Ruminococcus sp.]|nr:hypothetical protein [Ruminococcus sp.]
MRKHIALLSALLITLGASASCGSGSSGSESTAASGKTDIEIPSSAMDDASRALDEAAGKGAGDDSGNAECDDEAVTVLKDYVGSMFSGDTLKALKYMYPQKIYDFLAENGGENAFGSGVSGFELDEMRIGECSRLAPDTGYKTVEDFFNLSASNNGIDGVSVTVSDGYCAEVWFRITDGTNTDEDTENVVLAYIDGEGWKVIPLGIEELTDQVSKAK